VLCRCGFLGPLHLEVFLQRLQQEYAASVISTAPTVPYELEVQGGSEQIRLESIAEYPRNTKVRA
jgi:GTP-binding protein LepA